MSPDFQITCFNTAKCEIGFLFPNLFENVSGAQTLVDSAPFTRGTLSRPALERMFIYPEPETWSVGLPLPLTETACARDGPRQSKV